MTEWLDFLYCLGCEFDLTENDIRNMCRAFDIDFETLQKHTGPTTHTSN